MEKYKKWKPFIISIYMLLFVPLVSLAHIGDWKGKITKEKTLEQHFSVTKNAQLKLSNRYGIIQIQSWDKPEINIKVNIRINADTENRVNEYLNDIDVDFLSSKDWVSAETQIKSNFVGKKTSIEINYIVFMPVTASLQATNKYGDIRIDKLNGSADINIKYGSLNIGELWHDINRIEMKYSTGSHIDILKRGEINASYSSLKIQKSQNLQMKSSYTQIQVEAIEFLNLESKYGGLEAEKIGVIKGETSYFSCRINELEWRCQMEQAYGNLQIDKILKSADQVDIEGAYTNIKLGFEPQWKFLIKAKVSYAGFEIPSSFAYKKKRKEVTSYYYLGYHLDSNSTNKLNVESRYGNVRIVELK